MLAREYPDRHAFQHDLASSYSDLAIVARTKNDLDRAETANKSALDIYRSLRGSTPTSATTRSPRPGPTRSWGSSISSKTI